MGILRKLIQWREKSDGTLEGPALSTGEGYTESVPDVDDAIPNVGWVDNLIVTNETLIKKVDVENVESVDVSWDEGKFDRVIFEIDSIYVEDSGSRYAMRINGHDGDDYHYTLNSGSETQSDDEFVLYDDTTSTLRGISGRITLSQIEEPTRVWLTGTMTGNRTGEVITAGRLAGDIVANSVEFYDPDDNINAKMTVIGVNFNE